MPFYCQASNAILSLLLTSYGYEIFCCNSSSPVSLAITLVLIQFNSKFYLESIHSIHTTQALMSF
jgi:hypothetical protein